MFCKHVSTSLLNLHKILKVFFFLLFQFTKLFIQSSLRLSLTIVIVYIVCTFILQLCMYSLRYSLLVLFNFYIYRFFQQLINRSTYRELYTERISKYRLIKVYNLYHCKLNKFSMIVVEVRRNLGGSSIHNLSLERKGKGNMPKKKKSTLANL